MLFVGTGRVGMDAATGTDGAELVFHVLSFATSVDSFQ